ncbi:MAG TPA: sigma-54 dependent transcriptional regulator [Polyangiaceae bacterium]|nr:sigma-54 dependent transcriptional regulator [Polyangiaceae bacterium]
MRGETGGFELWDSPPRILVVDDEPEMRRTLTRLLTSQGMTVVGAPSGEDALEILEREPIDVALVDLQMPGLSGLDILREIKARELEAAVIIMTAHGDVEVAVSAMHAGAHHFLTKPFRSSDEIVLTARKAAELRRLRDRNTTLERRLLRAENFGDLIGNSPRMHEVYGRAMGVAGTTSTVLITGESGTGKELTARAIHAHSTRATGRFVTVNCSAIPENLIESELFGHVRGAFTGAASNRLGLFERAHEGTLFLDEIGDLPLLAQVKVLRALQEGEVRRVGSDETRHVDVRIVAATNVDLRERIAAGRFRQDLFYRLSVVEVALPALRERAEDIPLLAYHFLQKHADSARSDVKRISPEALKALQSRSWPGNVRELENAIQHAIVFCRGATILPGDLPASSPGENSQPPRANASKLARVDLPYRDAKERAMEDFEVEYFTVLLARTAGNVSEAARQAGLDRSNFRRALRRAKIRERGSEAPEFAGSRFPPGQGEDPEQSGERLRRPTSGAPGASSGPVSAGSEGQQPGKKTIASGKARY